jgi:vanillate O-demethylase monooxygenase subunit
VTTFLHDFNRTVVMQDVDALNLLQKTLDTEPDGYQELSINIDTGDLAARRILARLAAEGEQRSSSAAATSEPAGR